MSVLNIDLSEFDAMRNRNKELEERVEQLKKDLEGCKNGSKVIIRKVVIRQEKEYQGRNTFTGRPEFHVVAEHEDVVSESYVGFEDVQAKIENAMRCELEETIRLAKEREKTFSDKYEELDGIYEKKRIELEHEYVNKENVLRDNIKKELDEANRYRTKYSELSRTFASLKSQVFAIATDAIDSMESKFFKPHRAISLVREIKDMVSCSKQS